MPRVTVREAEPLQAEIRTFLETVGRPGDHERMAQRLAKRHSEGTHVVGFRRRGREVLLHRERTLDRPNELTIHEVGRDGQLSRVSVCWKGRDLERWLRRHHHYLEWIDPGYEVGGAVRGTTASE